MADKTVDVEVKVTSDTRGATAAAKALEATAQSAEHLGTTTAGAEAETKTLDERIQGLKDHIVALGQEFERSGSRQLLFQADAERREVGRMQRLKKDLDDSAKLTEEAGQAAEKAATWFGRLGDNIGAGFSSLASGFSLPSIAMPSLIPVLIGAAVAASPAIGAAISGAVAGLGGLGGIAGGVLSATHDPAVKAALGDFGKSISATFFSGGGSFVQPVSDSLKILERDFASLDLGAAFAKTAPYVTELARGIGEMVRNLMPGFNAILDKSGPIIATLSNGLVQTGTALSDLMAKVAGSSGTIQGLSSLFQLTDGAIELLGNLLAWLTDRWHDLINVGSDMTHWADNAFGWIPVYGSMVRDFAGHWDALRYSIDSTSDAAIAVRPAIAETIASIAAGSDVSTAAAQALDEYRSALDALDRSVTGSIDQHLKLDNAILVVKVGWTTLEKELAKTNATTDAGQQAIQHQIKALEEQRKVQQETSDQSVESIQQIDDAYDRQLQKLLDLAKQAGATKAQLAQLSDEYYIKLNIDTSLTSYDPIGSGDRTWQHMPRATPRAAHRAMGGPVMAEMPYQVNELGSETVTFPANGMVHPASLTPAPVMSAQPLVLNGGGLGELVFEWLRTQIQARGGTLAVIGIRG